MADSLVVAGAALRLGELAPPRFNVFRSGLRWLAPDGHHCYAGEVVAFCNIGLTRRTDEASGVRHSGPAPFLEESADLQLTLAPSHAGILRRAQERTSGGYINQLPFYKTWNPDETVGWLECEEAANPHLILAGAAGRRATQLSEDHSGLLTGWHNRKRAWHAETDGHLTVLGLGICEQSGVFLGEHNGFLEILEQSPIPLHVVYVGDEALVPTSVVLIDQLTRDPSACATIAADMARGVLDCGITPTPEDLIFCGNALAALQRKPFDERFDVLSRRGLATDIRIDAVVLSVNAEAGKLLRHRKLGYHAFWHSFRIHAAAVAVREWLQIAFEPVHRSLDQIGRDLLTLSAMLHERGVRKVLIMNAMSSSGYEDLASYAAFPEPLGDTVCSVYAKQVNLMLHDIAEQSDIAIIDADAIAARLGGAAHLPDGIHQSGRMQDDLRSAIIAALL